VIDCVRDAVDRNNALWACLYKLHHPSGSLTAAALHCVLDPVQRSAPVRTTE